MEVHPGQPWGRGREGGGEGRVSSATSFFMFAHNPLHLHTSHPSFSSPSALLSPGSGGINPSTDHGNMARQGPHPASCPRPTGTESTSFLLKHSSHRATRDSGNRVHRLCMSSVARRVPALTCCTDLPLPLNKHLFPNLLPHPGVPSLSPRVKTCSLPWPLLVFSIVMKLFLKMLLCP